MRIIRITCLFIGLVLLTTSCPMLHLYDFIYFDDKTEDALYFVMQFNPTDDVTSEIDYFTDFTTVPGKYQLLRFSNDPWSNHIKDSIVVYLASLDSLTKRYDVLELHPSLVQPEDLLARLTINRDVLTKGNRTITFPPDEDPRIRVLYYNNYTPSISH